MPYRDFLRTDYWQAVAAQVKKRDGYRCVVCNSPEQIEAHHRTYRNHGEEHLHLEDLTTLCRKCHKTFHGHLPIPEENKPVAIPKHILATDCEQVLLTKKTLDQCRTKGAFTSATIRALGFDPGKMTAGWVSRLKGTVIPRTQYLEAVKGTNIYAPSTRRRKQQTAI